MRLSHAGNVCTTWLACPSHSPPTDPPSWLAGRLAELDCGEVEKLRAAARRLRVSDTPMEGSDKALGYFETNRLRMRHARVREMGLLVGPGAREAGCRALVAQRLKLSGMRWSGRGSAAFVGLRSQESSGPVNWEEVWQWHPAGSRWPDPCAQLSCLRLDPVRHPHDAANERTGWVVAASGSASGGRQPWSRTSPGRLPLRTWKPQARRDAASALPPKAGSTIAQCTPRLSSVRWSAHDPGLGARAT